MDVTEPVVRRILAVFLLALTWAQVSAQSNASGSLIDGRFDASSRTARLLIGRDLLKQVGNFADVLPSPKPADVHWVETEQAAIEQISDSGVRFKRFSQLYDAPEFHHVKLHNALQSVKSALQCVLEPSVPLRREMLCWATAGFVLGDSNTYSDGIKVLRRANRLPDNPAVGVAELLFYGFAQGIQKHLVIGYLRNDFK